MNCRFVARSGSLLKMLHRFVCSECRAVREEYAIERAIAEMRRERRDPPPGFATNLMRQHLPEISPAIGRKLSFAVPMRLVAAASFLGVFALVLFTRMQALFSGQRSGLAALPRTIQMAGGSTVPILQGKPSLSASSKTGAKVPPKMANGRSSGRKQRAGETARNRRQSDSARPSRDRVLPEYPINDAFLRIPSEPPRIPLSIDGDRPKPIRIVTYLENGDAVVGMRLPLDFLTTGSSLVAHSGAEPYHDQAKDEAVGEIW